MKKLYRRKNNRTFLGVCSGIADYLEIDPTVIKILWIVFSLMGGSGLLAYFICAIIMPLEP